MLNAPNLIAAYARDHWARTVFVLISYLPQTSGARHAPALVDIEQRRIRRAFADAIEGQIPILSLRPLVSILQKSQMRYTIAFSRTGATPWQRRLQCFTFV